MQRDMKLTRRTAPLLSCALLAVYAGGCAEDLKVDEAEENTEIVVTEPDGAGFITQVDASNSDAWIYFSFETGAQVVPADPANSTEWDLAFQRFHIISNGGVSGSGGAAVALLLDQTFDAVIAAPADGYIADQPDGEDDDTIVESAFSEGDGWYAYDQATNRLSPHPIVYVVQTAGGGHYKLSILDYYDGAGTSGHPSFSWAAL